jgi:hypothetical protein
LSTIITSSNIIVVNIFQVINRMLSVLDATRRTNLFLEDRYALSLRLHAPSLFAKGKTFVFVAMCLSFLWALLMSMELVSIRGYLAKINVKSSSVS